MTDQQFQYHLGLIYEERNGEYYCLDIKDICDLLNELTEENKKLKEDLDNFEFSHTQDFTEFNKDELYIKDNNIEIILKGQYLFINVLLPRGKDSMRELYEISYIVTGKSVIRNFYDKWYDLSNESEITEGTDTHEKD